MQTILKYVPQLLLFQVIYVLKLSLLDLRDVSTNAIIFDLAHIIHYFFQARATDHLYHFY
jgi:hypothetical protein